MSLVLPRSRATFMPGWVRNDLWRRARAVPSLDLRFADRKSLVDAISGQNLVTFTRASGGTYVDSAGVLQTAGANEPRFDHNPTTGESLGLLVEEQRTNEVRNSNNMSAVVTGSPGTLPTGWSAQVNSSGWTREVVGSGSIGTLNYVDIRFSGTPTTGQFVIVFQSQGAVAASNGQSWAPSVYYQLVGGSLGNIIGYPASNLWSSGLVFLGSTALTGTIVPGSTMQRYTGATTINNASTAFISWGITFTCTIGNTYDFTIRFAGPQLEAGSFPTSYIPTTTSAATRAADVASITGSAFSSWYRQDEGTVFADFLRGYSGNFPNFPNLYQFNNGTDDNEVTLFGNQGAQFVQPFIRVGASAQLDFTGFTSTFPGPNRSAHGFSLNNSTFAANGVLTTPDTSVNLPTVNQVNFGARSGQRFNGHYRRLTYFPARLPDATLQAITQ